MENKSEEIDMLEFLIFSIRKKWKNSALLFIFLGIVIFLASQLTSVLYYPVRNTQDILNLEKVGEGEKIYIDKSVTQKKLELIQLIEKEIKKEDVSEDNKKNFLEFITDLENNNIEHTARKYNKDETKQIYAFIMQNLNSINKEYNNPEEINKALNIISNNHGYQIKLQNMYITYLQAILGFTLVPIVLFMVQQEKKQSIKESLVISAYSNKKHFVNLLLTIIIPIIIFGFVVGEMINIFSYLKFILNGYNISYTSLLPKYVLFCVPSILCFSSVLIFLMYSFNSYISLIPLYLMWIIFNITPNATDIPKFIQNTLVFCRLDSLNINPVVTQIVVLRQLLICIASIGILILTYFLERSFKNEC